MEATEVNKAARLLIPSAVALELIGLPIMFHVSPEPSCSQSQQPVEAVVSDMHGHFEVSADSAPTVELFVMEDMTGGTGYNINIQTTRFTFTPEDANTAPVAGTGHAHLYIDGVKTGRVYDNWYYINELSEGSHIIEVTLNANDHSEYTVAGERIADSRTIEVVKRDKMSMQHKMIDVDPAPGVDLVVEKDDKGGWNLQIKTTGFKWTPENVNKEAVPGEGHAHLYIDGVKITRLYGAWYHLAGLAAGEHEIEITLNANNHDEWATSGQHISDIEILTVR